MRAVECRWHNGRPVFGMNGPKRVRLQDGTIVEGVLVQVPSYFSNYRAVFHTDDGIRYIPVSKIAAAWHLKP
jgi:hypothetical protein